MTSRFIRGPLDGWTWLGTDRAVIGYPAGLDAAHQPEGETAMFVNRVTSPEQIQQHYNGVASGLYRRDYVSGNYVWEATR